MAKIVLAKPGEEATLAIAEVEVLAGDQGNMVRFLTMTGDELAISEGAVMRQLDRCGVAELADLAGKIVHFSRAANKNPKYSPYWNLDVATEADIKKAATSNGKPPVSQAIPKVMPGKPVAAQQPDNPKYPNAANVPGGIDDAEYADAIAGESDKPSLSAEIREAKCRAIRDAHARAFAIVVADYVPMAAAAGVELELHGVSALTFQLFQAQQEVR